VRDARFWGAEGGEDERVDSRWHSNLEECQSAAGCGCSVVVEAIDVKSAKPWLRRSYIQYRLGKRR